MNVPIPDLSVTEILGVLLAFVILGAVVYLVSRNQFMRTPEPKRIVPLRHPLAVYASQQGFRFLYEAPPAVWHQVLQLVVLRKRILVGLTSFSKAYIDGSWGNKQFFAVNTGSKRPYINGHAVAMRLTDDQWFPTLIIKTRHAGARSRKRSGRNHEKFEDRFSITCEDPSFINHFLNCEMRSYLMLGYSPATEISGQHVVVVGRDSLNPLLLDRHLLHLSNMVDVYRQNRMDSAEVNQSA